MLTIVTVSELSGDTYELSIGHCEVSGHYLSPALGWPRQGQLPSRDKRWLVGQFQ